ncbi:MAG: tetratricopeptide repeat protein [Treponemataceae bacterium]
MKIVLIFWCYFLLFSSSFFATDYSQGITFLSDGNYDKAIDFFAPFLISDTIDPEVLMFLGVAHYQKGNFSQSLQMFEKGLTIPFVDKAVFYFNAGNAAFALNQFDLAEVYFTQTLNFDSSNFSAYLNRGNTRIRLDKMSEAFEDYESYIKKSDDTAMSMQLRTLIDNFNEQQAHLAELAASLLIAENITEQLIEEMTEQVLEDYLGEEGVEEVIEDIDENPIGDETEEIGEDSESLEDESQEASLSEDELRERAISQMLEKIIERIVERTMKKIIEESTESIRAEQIETIKVEYSEVETITASESIDITNIDED